MYVDVSNIVAGLRDDPAAQQRWVQRAAEAIPLYLVDTPHVNWLLSPSLSYISGQCPQSMALQKVFLVASSTTNEWYSGQ